MMHDTMDDLDFKNLLEDVIYAGKHAELPEHYQWGLDAISSYQYGKLRATEDIVKYLKSKRKNG